MKSFVALALAFLPAKARHGAGAAAAHRYFEHAVTPEPDPARASL